MDLRDLEHNTSDGLHMASLAGAWMALVGGLRRAARRRTGRWPSPRACPAASPG